uniref:site-specific integrase n=1 Tax=Streptomyces africanus TaxID=231024 RepID=UPI001ABF7C72
MLETDDAARDLAGFVLPETGALIETKDPQRPYVLVDAEGATVAPVEAFFAELQASSRPATTIRSYGMDLLRWWRFLSGWDVAWNRASRRDARDFARWMQIAPKVSRAHWRHRASGEGPAEALTRPSAGVPNPVTGRAAPGSLYSASTRVHCETVLRSFYDFHLEEGTGPIINPFPSARERRR